MMQVGIEVVIVTAVVVGNFVYDVAKILLKKHYSKK